MRMLARLKITVLKAGLTRPANATVRQFNPARIQAGQTGTGTENKHFVSNNGCSCASLPPGR